MWEYITQAEFLKAFVDMTVTEASTEIPAETPERFCDMYWVLADPTGKSPMVIMGINMSEDHDRWDTEYHRFVYPCAHVDHVHTWNLEVIPGYCTICGKGYLQT